MKTIKLKSSLLAGIVALFLLFSGKGSSLKDITKPYLGEYECTNATFNGEDYLDRFSYIRLLLEGDETYSLLFCEKGNERQQVKGNYTYDEKEKTITFSIEENSFLKRKFKLENGILNIVLPIGNKILLMQFEQK